MSLWETAKTFWDDPLGYTRQAASNYGREADRLYVQPAQEFAQGVKQGVKDSLGVDNPYSPMSYVVTAWQDAPGTLGMALDEYSREWDATTGAAIESGVGAIKTAGGAAVAAATWYRKVIPWTAALAVVALIAWFYFDIRPAVRKAARKGQ